MTHPLPVEPPEPSEPHVTAEPAESIFRGRHRLLTFGVLATVLLVAFEGISVATALPVAARELDGLPLYAWAFSGFLITSLVGMVLSGDLCDRRGPLRPLAAALAMFMVGLVLAGTAGTMPLFVLGRAMQGFGAGMYIVALYVVVARAYPERLRPRMFSLMSAGWVLPSIVGPLLAGWLTENLSWRWVFLGLVPFVPVAAAVMLPGTLGLPDAVVTRGADHRRLLQAVAAAVGVAALQYAGQHLRLASLGLVAVALVLLGPSLPKLLPRGTLRFAPGLPSVILLRGLLAGAFFGTESFLPLMLVRERGLSATEAGLTLTSAALSWSLGSWWQGRLAVPARRPRLVRAGSALVGVAIATAMLTTFPAVPPALAALAWLIGGAGMGLGIASLSVLVLEHSPDAEQGANSAALQLSDAFGSILLIGLAGVLFAALHGPAGHDQGVYLIIDAVMLGVALLATGVATRVGGDSRQLASRLGGTPRQ